MTTSRDDDHALAAELAAAAGRILLETRATTLFEAKALGRAGDAVAQQLLANALLTHRPDDAVLSEEAADDAARLSAQRVWIIDPLDGTREYGEGRHDWAVHVALATDGAPGASAVALPGVGDGMVLSTANPAAVPDTGGRAPRIAVSRSRAPEVADQVAEALGAELVPMGSAGYKTMAVATGEVDAYLHAGGQYEWDSAAPVGVALAHGLHASRIDGSPLAYNQADPLLPDLLVCRPELAEPILSAVAAAGVTA